MRAVLLVAGLVLGACAPDPPAVTVGLYQTRSDTPLNKIEMQVRNDGRLPVTVERAILRSTRLTGAPVWDEPVPIPPGTAVDLKVALPPAVCNVAAADEVELTVDGRMWMLPARDLLGQLAAYQDEQCFRQEVADAGSVRVVGLTGGSLQVEVTGGLTIGDVGTTTLFRPADPSALARGMPVRLRPNRCDAHALADDKQGTYFPVEVTLPDGRSGRYMLSVDAHTRSRLYSFYARECGL